MFFNVLSCFYVDLLWCHLVLQTEKMLENIWYLDRKQQYYFSWTLSFPHIWRNGYGAKLSTTNIKKHYISEFAITFPINFWQLISDMFFKGKILFCLVFGFLISHFMLMKWLNCITVVLKILDFWGCNFFQTFSKNYFSQLCKTQYLRICLAKESKLSPNPVEERFSREYIRNQNLDFFQLQEMDVFLSSLVASLFFTWHLSGIANLLFCDGGDLI